MTSKEPRMRREEAPRRATAGASQAFVGADQANIADGRTAAVQEAAAPSPVRAAWRVAVALVLLSALVAATYAWFTSNTKVSTSEVSVRSDQADLAFELGDADAGSWSSEGEAALTSVSPAGDVLTLYPVSTTDLGTFVECSLTTNSGKATSFVPCADGEKYYHGHIDLRASLTGQAATAQSGRVKLYLAQSPVPEGSDATLLRAARLGLKLSSGGQAVSTRILTLDDSAGTGRDEHPQTAPALDGYVDGMVLGWDGSALTCAADPSKPYTDCMIASDGSGTLPGQALATLELGQVYRLDVYFYIEGTDADSAGYLSGSAGTLSLGLFAVLDGSGE